MRSNGHGRAEGTADPMGRMANLFLRSTKKVPVAQLKEMLLDEVRRQGKPFGLIIRDITGGSTNTSNFGYQAFKGQPRLVYRVDAKTGAETLVRGVEMVGTPLTTVSRIVATSDTEGVFNGFCGAESGLRAGLDGRAGGADVRDRAAAHAEGGRAPAAAAAAVVRYRPAEESTAWQAVAARCADARCCSAVHPAGDSSSQSPPSSACSSRSGRADRARLTRDDASSDPPELHTRDLAADERAFATGAYWVDSSRERAVSALRCSRVSTVTAAA